MFTSWWSMRDGETKVQELRQDATVRLPRRHGALRVQVERGAVVITREGDPQDYVLTAGQEVTLPARGLAVAWALAPARLTLVSPRVRRPLDLGRIAAANVRW